MPRLEAVEATNFKNLKFDYPISLGDLNIFIGPNGSGKSNFIDLLRFLNSCIASTAEKSQEVGGLEKAVSEIGGTRILDLTVERPSRVSFRYFFNTVEPVSQDLTFDLKLFIDKTSTKVTVYEEFLGRKAQPGLEEPFYFYRFHDRHPGEGVISIKEQEVSSSSHFELIYDIPTNELGLSALPLLLEKSKYPPSRTPVYPVRRELVDFISNWQFYNSNNMNLSEIRSSEPIIGPVDIYVSPTGGNLPTVMDNLFQDHVDFEETITDELRTILPITRRLRTARVGRLRLAVEWYFNGINEPVYLNDLSDGTVRMLIWAVVLLSPVKPKLLIIDEPEFGLHVSWMKTLAEWIKTASKTSQLIVSTHSPDLLDHFSDRIDDVHVFKYVDNNHFSINKLSQERINDRLQEGWQLGDLYRVGDPDIGGWPW